MTRVSALHCLAYAAAESPPARLWEEVTSANDEDPHPLPAPVPGAKNLNQTR